MTHHRFRLPPAIAAGVLFVVAALLALVHPAYAQSEGGACAGGAVADAANNPGLVSDCETLLASRDILAGTRTLNWSLSIPIDQWEGVIVGGSPLRVTELNLNGKLRAGKIPSELNNLTSLRRLNLAHNRLTGPIPPEIGEISTLQDLWLGNNQLTGTIPSSLGGLANLQRLSLRQNHLSGPIPPSLGGLENLQHLSLWENRLTGPIPSELGGLANLLGLFLSDNHLTGPIPNELGRLWRLQTLELGGNELTGEIPAELGSLVNLRKLDLSHNDLTGEIPAEMGSLVNLGESYLYGNRFAGCIPTGLRETPKNDFDSLNLPFCDASPDACSAGTAVPNAANNPGLVSDCEALLAARDILAGRARLNWSVNTPISTWQGIAVAGTPQRVTELALHNRALTGTVPGEIGSLSSLQKLDLRDNHLTGQLPSELDSLSSLRELWLAGNQLTGCVPAGLRVTSNNDLASARLPFCDELQDSCATGNAVPDAANNPGLVSDCYVLLSARDTLAGDSSLNWSAQTPLTSWNGVSVGGSPQHVTELVLQNKTLSGTIPGQLGDLTGLEVMVLSRNELTGEIPAELGSLTNLQVLELSWNNLVGEIPAELSGLANLRELGLGETG